MNRDLLIVGSVIILVAGVLVITWISGPTAVHEQSIAEEPIPTEPYSRRDDQLWHESYVAPLQIGREFWDL